MHLCSFSIIIDLPLINYINLRQITFHFITYYYKNIFFIVFSEVALRAAKSVKRDTVHFVSGTRSNSPPPPPPTHTFLILKLFIRCLLVGVREWLLVGISLSYKWKQIGVFFRRIIYVYELFST